MFLSSSFHKINADRTLSPVRKKLYRAFNALHNNIPDFFPDRDIVVSPFVLDGDLMQGFVDESPSRQISNLFWRRLNWEKLKADSGGIRLLDFGCGTGRYAKRWMEWSGKNLESYLGIDVEKNGSWPENDAFFRMKILGKEIQQKEAIAQTNVIFSQSVLEHVENDMIFFRDVAEAEQMDGTPRIQIHLIPPESGYKQWPFHGVRQYTRRSISQIGKLFPSARKALFFMGGKESLNVQLSMITAPHNNGEKTDLRHSEPTRYKAALEKAMRSDMNNFNPPACFYGFIIDSTGKFLSERNEELFT